MTFLCDKLVCSCLPNGNDLVLWLQARQEQLEIMCHKLQTSRLEWKCLQGPNTLAYYVLQVMLKCTTRSMTILLNFQLARRQCDQKIEQKLAQCLEKVAKNTKMFRQKLNFKAQNILIKPLLKPLNIYIKPLVEITCFR